MIKEAILIITLMLIVSGAQAGTLNASTLFYMPANGTAGSTAFTDLSQYASVLTANGDAKIGQSNNSWRFNNASYFDGNNDAITGSRVYNFSTKPVGISFWYNGTSNSGSYNQIFGTNESPAAAGGWFILTRVGGGNKVGIVTYNPSEHDYWESGSTNTNDGVWHYFRMQRVGGILSLCVDGVEKINSTSFGTTSMLGGDTKTSGLSIGKSFRDSNYITGYIDDVVIYEGNLSCSPPAVEWIDSGPASLAASFSVNATSGTAPRAIAVTDTSVGSPTAWNYSVTNVTPGNNTPIYFSTTQNPVITLGVGDWSFSLNASTATAYNLSTQVTFVNVTAGGGTAPLAMFGKTRSVLIFPGSVTFSDQSTNTPTAWNWSFGDGTYSDSQNPSHQYVKRGRWTVLLNASNTAGFSTNSTTIWLIGG